VESIATQKFWKCFELLPSEIQDKAKQTYHGWKADPFNPQFSFKQMNSKRAVFSIRIALKYRALAIKQNNTKIWFWIGSHEDYNNLVNER
jgi:hypothetical protein